MGIVREKNGTLEQRTSAASPMGASSETSCLRKKAIDVCLVLSIAVLWFSAAARHALFALTVVYLLTTLGLGRSCRRSRPRSGGR